jgi:hypothetical protein
MAVGDVKLGQRLTASVNLCNALYVSASNVGVGIANPAARLVVADSVNSILVHLTGGSNPRLRIEENANSYVELADSSVEQMTLRKVSSAGNVLMDINPFPNDGLGTANVRFFRETNTTGGSRLLLHKGDGTATTHVQVGVGSLDTYFSGNGDVGIGTSDPGGWKLYIQDGQGALAISASSDSGAYAGSIALDSTGMKISHNSAGRDMQIFTKNTRLSLSGSHVRMSASLGLDKRVSTSLPAGSVELSGTILWVDNLKQFAIYGPLGWTRILTGTVVS